MSGPAPLVRVYCVGPSAAPGGHPRPSAGAATIAVCAQQHRPSRTPCADVPPVRQSQSPGPDLATIQLGHDASCVGLPNHVDFFWRINSAVASANALSFAQSRAPAGGWSHHVHFLTRQPGRKTLVDLCTPFHDLGEIQNPLRLRYRPNSFSVDPTNESFQPGLPPSISYDLFGRGRALTVSHS
jgi:hypothetical protein